MIVKQSPKESQKFANKLTLIMPKSSKRVKQLHPLLWSGLSKEHLCFFRTWLNKSSLMFKCNSSDLLPMWGQNRQESLHSTISLRMRIFKGSIFWLFKTSLTPGRRWHKSSRRSSWLNPHLYKYARFSEDRTNNMKLMWNFGDSKTISSSWDMG